MSTYKLREFVLSVLPVTVSTVLISSFLSASLWMISSRLGRNDNNTMTITKEAVQEVAQICK